MTRLVDLVLSTEEEKAVKNEIKEEKIDDVVKEEKGDSFMDASTQTAPERKKRGGQGSRRRRLLAFQLMLKQRQGLPSLVSFAWQRKEPDLQGRGEGQRLFSRRRR